MFRTDIINRLIENRGYKTYLEIGVETPANNFDRIVAEEKYGVDPAPKDPVAFQMTSDEFFANHAGDLLFDIVFVDGLHHADQVLRDVENALSVLKPGGAIVMHDVLPHHEDMQVCPYHGGMWTGDVWKAWVVLRGREDLDMMVVDTDYGCGVIFRGAQTPFHARLEDLDWQFFVDRRDEVMNVVSIQEFLDRIEKEQA